MAVLPLRYAPDPVLRTKTRRVHAIDAKLLMLIDDMIDTLRDAQGVGLAANQIGAPWRVAVIQLPEDEEPRVLINPHIVRREGEREVDEGCLSIPGYRGTVKRSERVRVRALDRNGKQIRIKAEDLLAQALEHEMGHLNGGLYIDLLESPDMLYKIEQVEEGEGHGFVVAAE